MHIYLIFDYRWLRWHYFHYDIHIRISKWKQSKLPWFASYGTSRKSKLYVINIRLWTNLITTLYLHSEKTSSIPTFFLLIEKTTIIIFIYVSFIVNSLEIGLFNKNFIFPPFSNLEQSSTPQNEIPRIYCNVRFLIGFVSYNHFFKNVTFFRSLV